MTITCLAELQVASLQEIFDHVSRHLLWQRRPSMDKEEYECLFIDEYGCRCALGACMTDQEARQYNGLDLSSIPEFRDLSDNRKDLIRALVNCHDYANVKDWPDELRDIAAKSSLDCKF